MLLDLLDLLVNPAVFPGASRLVLAYDPPDGGPWFDEHVPAGYALRPQQGNELGQRMADFFEGEFEQGSERVVLIGSDAPSLDPSHITSAFLCLEANDVVLGPATDGGYYLVGARSPLPPIFHGPEWGSARVLAQTIEQLRDTKLRLAVLPPWYDVDTVADWNLLTSHLAAVRRSGLNPGLPRIESLAASLPRTEEPG
jgi:rSAM/selenodomain-associated transferase 1